ncbi:MAG: hypothetical protein AB7N91_31955 [Candidatus Tectimicrobiota bacterium]
MAGTLEVTDDLCWMPAGWVFDAVLARIAQVLHPQDPALAAWLLAARTEANGGYLDLRDLEGARWTRLCHAAECAYAQLLRDVESPRGGAASVEGLRAQFDHLRTMLQAARTIPVG